MTVERVVKKEVVTNARYAKENDVFRDACVKAGVEPTTRQASKWRLKKGKAFRHEN